MQELTKRASTIPVDGALQHAESAKEQIEKTFTIPVGEALLTTEQAAAWAKMTPRFFEARRVRGDGPDYVRISARAVRYRLSDLISWAQARVKSSTSEA